MPVRRRKGKQGKQGGKVVVPRDPTELPNAESITLVLTSDKRRGVYECDYCHADISQTPRIRCAVCDDFDLCCDCFAYTDQSTAIARLRSAGHTHDPKAHGYRVCDSGRHPLFPTKIGIKQQGLKKRSAGLEILERKYDKEVVMCVDEVDTARPPPGVADFAQGTSLFLQAGDDSKSIWTVEEDLRLLRGIETHGMGNWSEVAESVAGQGSIGKTPKRCMERYFDDFLGRFGYILPPFTFIAEQSIDENDIEKDADSKKDQSEALPKIPSKDDERSKLEDLLIASSGEATRTSKRRSAMLRSPSTASSSTNVASKRYKAVSTETTENYSNIQYESFVPKVVECRVELGQEVRREASARAEHAYVRAISSLETAEQVKKAETEWKNNRLNKPGGPTVLPMRPDDVAKLPGSDLLGFMPRRGDFDVEWENSAEEAVADMEFNAGESEEDRQLKIQVLSIYNAKLSEREKRKDFVLNRKLYDYRKCQADYKKSPRDEQDLILRMRLFERFQTPFEHERFISDLLKTKKLRKEIAKLQTYRRMGIRTLLEAEKYELDKSRRMFHKNANVARESDEKRSEVSAQDAKVAPLEDDTHYWKQYKTSERKVRKSINRGDNSTGETSSKDQISRTANVDRNSPPRKAAQGPPGIPHSPEESGLPQSERSKFSDLEGFRLLSSRESSLCECVGLSPRQYLVVKNLLVKESLEVDLLEDKACSRNRYLSSGKLGKKGSPNAHRGLAMIDVKRRGTIVDFLVQVGWISSKFGKTITSDLCHAIRSRSPSSGTADKH